jgi:hypothetical protein
MTASWFRVSVRVSKHPKVTLLSSDSVRWTLLLVWAEGKADNTRGRWSNIDHLCACLPGRPRRHILELIKAGLLDQAEDGSISVHNWPRWQSCSPDDPTAAERQRRHRSKALQSRDGHGEVTPLRHGQTETETETETEKEGEAPPCGPFTAAPGGSNDGR